MATKDDIEAARKRLEALWDDQGDCNSCGWHAGIGEHEIEDLDIEYALDENKGVLDLSCRNKSQLDDDEPLHRGVSIYIGEPK